MNGMFGSTAEERIISLYEPLIHNVDLPENLLSLKRLIPEVPSEDVIDLTRTTIELLSKRSAYVEVAKPSIVVGDIHGNLVDLLKIFRLYGTPMNRSYVFLGDYVDRGDFSVPVILLLFAYFCKYPDNVVLLRGNHEFSHINRIYGFFDEVLGIYNSELVWLTLQCAFSWLPVACSICKHVFCVHGGITTQLKSVEQLRNLKLPIVTYENNDLICDLVWSDPSEKTGCRPNNRGAGRLFGKDVLQSFLKRNGFKVMFRGHQCVASGVCTFGTNLGATVFSSSDYCRIICNKAGIILMEEEGVYNFVTLGKNSQEFSEVKYRLFEKGNLGLKRVCKNESVIKNRTPRFMQPKTSTLRIEAKPARLPLTPHYRKPSTVLQKRTVFGLSGTLRPRSRLNNIRPFYL